MKKLFLKTFLSYFLVLILPIITLGILGYYMISDVISDQTRRSYAVITDQLANSFDNLFKEVDTLSTQLAYTPWVKEIMYMQGEHFDYGRMDGLELAQHVNELNTYDITNESISSIALYFPTQEFIVSSKGIQDANSFFNSTYRLNSLNFEQLKKMTVFYGIKLLKPDTLNYNGTSDKVVTYIRALPSPDLRPHGYFICYLPERLLLNKLNGFRISDNSSLYIIDENRKPLMETGGAGNDDLIEHLDFSKETYSMLAKINSERYYIFYRRSAVNNLSYVSTVPYNIVMGSVNNFKLIMCVLTLALSIIGLFISYRFTLKNCDPIFDVVNRFPANIGKDINTYDFLQNSINSLLSEEDMLRKEKQSQRDFIINSYFLKLFSKNITDFREFEENLKSLGIEFPYVTYTSAVFVFNMVKGITSEFQHLTSGKAHNYDRVIYWVEINGETKCAVMNTKDSEKLSILLQELKGLAEDYFGVDATIYVGNDYNTLDKLSLSYYEAQKTMNYRGIMDRKIIYYHNLNKDNQLYYYYPLEVETGISNAIRMGNSTEAIASIGRVVEANRLGMLTFTNVRCLLYSIYGTVLRVINDLDLNSKINTNGHVLDETDLNKAIGSIYDYCKMVCEVINKHKVSEDEVLKLNISKYIDENYDNSNI